MFLISLVWVVPMWRLLPKFGFNKWIAALGFVPMIGSLIMLVMLWVISFREPVNPRTSPEVFS